MPLFRKRSDVVDLTDLQKRGLLKKQNETLDNEDVPSYNQQSISSQSETPSNPLSFLDSLASVDPKPSPPNNNPTDIIDVKVKLEDFEYKLDRLTDKLTSIESKLGEFENKVS